MKSIALQVPKSGNHAGLWNLLRGFFHVPLYHGISRDPARPQATATKIKNESIFKDEDELEDYLRSFRD